MKKNIGVIVLNYLAYNETDNVVNQFLDLPKDDVNLKIVIVDNNSNNESYQFLSNKFNNNNLVSVYKTNKNLGFANGNNYGYCQLKKIFNPDYVIFSNSDIVLKSDELFHWIISSDKKYNFGVLGPSVYSLRYKVHQNPCNNWSENLYYNYLLLSRMKLQLLKMKLNQIIPIFKKNKPKSMPIDATDYQLVTFKKTLHGSFLVMSKKYLNHFSTPFDKGTFLYMEEAIIRIRCERSNLSMVYDPTYEVNHLQAVSTQKVIDSPVKRKIIRLNHEINSLKRFIQILKEK